MDGYAKTVVISIFDDCDILDKAIHLTRNVNRDSMVTVKVRKDRDLVTRSKYVYYNFSHVRICKHYAVQMSS